MKFHIGDFDLARCLQKRLKVTQNIVMSNAKLAPEIKAGEPHDQAVDIWALGQIIYKLLCALDDEEACLAVEGNSESMDTQEEYESLMNSCGNSHW